MNTEMLPRNYLAAGAGLSAMIAVGFGAYGAHGLDVNDTLRGMWETGVAYQMWHALGALAASWLASTRHGRTRKLVNLAGWCLVAGSFAFTGSLYFFIIDGIFPIPGLAPVGGTVMMAGWLGIVYGALRRQ